MQQFRVERPRRPRYFKLWCGHEVAMDPHGPFPKERLCRFCKDKPEFAGMTKAPSRPARKLLQLFED